MKFLNDWFTTVYVFCEKILKNRLDGVSTAFRRGISKKMYVKKVSCASEIICDLYYFIRHAESSPKPATAHAVGAEQFSINYSTSLINFIVPADK